MNKEPAKESSIIFRTRLKRFFPAVVFAAMAVTACASAQDTAAPMDILISQADSLRDAGQWEEALKTYELALVISRETGSEASEAAILHEMGMIYYDLGQLEDAFNRWEQALGLNKTLGDKLGEAEILKEIGWIYDDVAEYAAALEYYQQSLAISRELNERKLEAQNLNNIGVAYNNLSEYSKALDYYSQSLSIRRELGDRRGESRSLNNIGMVYDILSEHRRALEVYNQSLAISKELGDELLESRILGNMGVVYRTLSDYTTALDYYSQSLKLKRELGDRRGEAITLNNIGIVYDLLGDQKRALDYYQSSLSLSRETSDRWGEAEVLDNIGAAHEALARFDDALDYYRRSLEIKTEIGDRRGEGITLNNIGVIHFNLGKYPEALSYYLKDLEICRELGDHDGECITLTNIGMLYTEQKDYTVALKTIQSAVAIAQEFPTDVSVQYAYTALGQCYAAQGMDASAVNSYEKAIEAIEKVRGSLDVASYKSSFVSRSTDVYEAMILVLLRLGRAEDAWQFSERSRVRTFLDMLSAGRVTISESRHADFLGPDGKTEITELELSSVAAEDPLTLDEIQQLIDPERTFLEYYVTEDAVLIWVLTRDGVEAFRTEIDAKRLGDLVKGFRDAIVHEGAVARRSRMLYDLLIAPARGSLKTEKVTIIPHGILHYLPFCALHDGEGTSLLESYSICYLPSASVLKYLTSKARGEELAFLGFGNPETGREAYAPLPFAEREVNEIAGLFEVSRAFTGADASEAQFAQSAADFDILHLACHSDLNSTYPLFSGLILAPGQDEDGDLEVHEIFGTRIDADIVVLSSCQTGLGYLTTGDELVGLARAFLFAGTPAVLSSLWLVEDEATAYLMKRFYQNFKRQDKAEALRRAQMETKQAFPHSSAWAAFVLTGDPK